MTDKDDLHFFVTAHKKQINELSKQFVDLFNECGKTYNSEPIQMALTGIIIKTMFECTNVPLKDKKNLLNALKEKIK